MKLIRQIRLAYREGTSDKVYEVDLCEVGPDQFVVNFRYGRRGSALRDGTKTPLPVARAQAESTYDKLVRSKTKKGYAEEGAPAAAAPPSAPAAVAAPDAAPADPRAAAVAKRLDAGKNVERWLWRAGDLRLPLTARYRRLMEAGADDKRRWLLARALARSRDPQALPVLASLAEGSEPAGAWMARAGMMRLADASDREELAAAARRRVSSRVQAALNEPEATRVQAVIDALTDSPHHLTDLYLVSDVHGWLRPVVLELARRLPMRPPAFRVLRRLFKAAEMLPDPELYGLLSVRIETTRPMYTSPYWGTQVYRPGIGRVSVSDPRIGYSSATRTWWRRRLWRTLRRLGEAGNHDDYTAMATGLLLSVTDDDGRTPEVVTRYDYWQRTTVRVRATAPFSHLWSLSHVLYANSPRFVPQKRSLTVPCAPSAMADTPPSGREEAFGASWEAHPERLARLLAESRCEPVHEMAAGVFRALPDRWPDVPTAELLRWFEAPYAATRALAAELAVARYDAADPDKQLVLALLGCADADARATARSWVEANPTFFLSDLDFLTAIALHPLAETRRVATDLLAGTALSTEASEAFVARALEAARELSDGEAATEVLRDLAALLLTAFARELRSLPLDDVAGLIASPVEGAAELGAKVLLQHDVRPVDLPDTLLADVMTSPFAVVRGIGVRLFGELPDAVIAQRMAVVVHLCTSEHADLRSVVRPIVRRMADAQPAFAAALLRALLPSLTRPSDDDGLHRDLATLVRADLAAAHDTLGTEQILALTRASASAIQELGGQLLRSQVDPAALSLEQLATVACSDVRAVREGAFHLLRARGSEAATDPDALLPLFDAAWEGTRQFGMELFDEHVVSEGIDPDLLVSLCDSMRPDVQAFGRRAITRLFDASHGRALLQRLAEHPAPEMQTFASTWLPSYAADDPRFLGELESFFVHALSRVNRGRATKTRLFAFLRQEAERSEASATIVARVLGRVSATISIEDRARCIDTLTAIAVRWPEVAVPLTVTAAPVRRRSDHAV